MEKKKKNVASALKTSKETVDDVVRRLECGEELNEEQQLKICALPDGGELLLEYYAREGRHLCKKVQLKFFELPNASENVFKLAKYSQRLCKMAQLRIFELSGVCEIFMEYVKRGMRLSKETQLKICELENAREIFSVYAECGWHLSDEVLREVSEWPNACEFFHEMRKARTNGLSVSCI